MSIKILQCDSPNKNGRTYTRECIENALKNADEKIKTKRMVGHYNNSNDVAFIVKNLEVDEYGMLESHDIEILSTASGTQLQEDLKRGLVNFFTCGTGKLSDGMVLDYELHSIDAITKLK